MRTQSRNCCSSWSEITNFTGFLVLWSATSRTSGPPVQAASPSSNSLSVRPATAPGLCPFLHFAGYKQSHTVYNSNYSADTYRNMTRPAINIIQLNRLFLDTTPCLASHTVSMMKESISGDVRNLLTSVRSGTFCAKLSILFDAPLISRG